MVTPRRTLRRVAPDQQAAERERIQAIDEHLLVSTGVVVDDVVLRTWGNEQIELTHLLLTAAIAASGGDVDEADLWIVARAVAFPDRAPRVAPPAVTR